MTTTRLTPPRRWPALRPPASIYWDYSRNSVYPALDKQLTDTFAYPSRTLCLTLPGDTIVLPVALKPAFPHIQEHYQRVGLSHTSQVEWCSPGQAPAPPESHQALETTFFSAAAHQMQPNPARLAATSLLNHKNKFIELCHQLDVPTPRTQLYQAGQSPDLAQIEFPVYVKAAVSATGCHVIHCQTPSEVTAAVQSMPGDYQIQSRVPVTASFGVQYVARHGRAKHLATTRQLLRDQTVYNGSQYPARRNLRPITDPLADYAAQLGLEGFFNFDVVTGPAGTYILECNPRPSAATYPLGIAAKLGIRNWGYYKLPKRSSSATDNLILGPVEYNPHTKTGAIIVLWGAPHCIDIFIAGSTIEQHRSLAQLHAILTNR